MSTLLLRRGDASDVPTLDAIMQAAFDARYGEAWTRAQCLGIMALPGIWLTLAERDGEPAGFALTRAVVDEAELLLLATHPDHQRRGVAGALVRAVIAECRDAAVAKLHLEVRANNSAVAFYKANGFEKIGQRPDYYRGPNGKTFDAWTLQRTITL